MTKPPLTLKVNGRVIKLNPLPKSKMKDSFGLWHESKQRIDYRTRMLPTELRDTILHELFHALRYTQGREYGDEVEEDYVRSLATGLIGVLQDNPEFAKWLISITTHESPRQS